MKKRTLFITIGAFVLAGAVIAGVIIGTSASKRKNTTVVGFYDLPADYVDAIKETITGTTQGNYKFTTLEETDILSDKLSKNVDILISYNDANIQYLSEKAIPLTDGVLSRIPSTVKTSAYYTNKNNQTVVMPIIMDNFETTILKTTNSKYDIPQPTTTSKIENFARTSKYYYSTPIIIAGAEDINVLSLFTQMVIAYGGKDGYENVKTQLETLKEYSNIADLEIGGDSESGLKVKDVFDFIKNLQDKSYLASNWITLTQRDTEVLIDDNRVAMSLMNLSEHRKKPMPNIYFYETVVFPVETAKENVSLQPVVVALNFKDSEATRVALNRLSLEDSQEFLSLKTKLGPAMLRGTPCDIQADDARFYAASTEGGPVPDLGTATLKTKEQRHLLAEAIRLYFYN